MDPTQHHPGQPTPQGAPSESGASVDPGAPGPGWREGQDGVDPTYTERVWPGPSLWILSALGALVLAVAYGKVLGVGLGLVVLAVGLLVGVTVIVTTTPVLRLDSQVLRAGRARLPLDRIGRVVVLGRDGAAVARGPQGDATAYMVTRMGVAEAVLVEVVDEQDPHKTWLVATRHPSTLSGAIEAARGKVSP